MKKVVLALLMIASMDVYTAQARGIDAAEVCAQLKASGNLDRRDPKPEAVARGFMADIVDISPDQIRVVVASRSSLVTAVTATAPNGKTCLFSMIPAQAGSDYKGWMAGDINCRPGVSWGQTPVLIYHLSIPK